MHHTTSPVSWTETRKKVDVDHFVSTIELYNGIGEPVLAFDQAGPVADGAPWIARSWTERDVDGVAMHSYRPRFFTGDAYSVAANAPALAPVGNRLRVASDEFGRPIDTFDGATQTAHVKHAPLSTIMQDASQLPGAGPFAGLSSTRTVDGFGRTLETATPAGNGKDTTTTHVTYRATGEPLTMDRHGNADPVPYRRSMEWDSFGRMIRNHGVGHAWLVDPIARTLEVYRLQGRDWLRVGVFRDDARVRAEPFDAIELELDALWLAEP